MPTIFFFSFLGGLLSVCGFSRGGATCFCKHQTRTIQHTGKGYTTHRQRLYSTQTTAIQHTGNGGLYVQNRWKTGAKQVQKNFFFIKGVFGIWKKPIMNLGIYLRLVYPELNKTSTHALHTRARVLYTYYQPLMLYKEKAIISLGK